MIALGPNIKYLPGSYWDFWDHFLCLTEMSLGEALEVIEDVRPRQAFLVHLSHELSHATASAQLPKHVRVAYDGLRVEVGGGA